MNLSNEQLSIIESIPSAHHHILYANPGTGKTRIVSESINSLVSMDVDPQKILAVAYNKDAVKTLKDRIPHDAHISTLHSLCYGIIKPNIAEHFPHLHPLRVIDNLTTRIILNQIIPDKFNTPPSQVLRSIYFAKSRLQKTKNGILTTGDEEMDKIFGLYEQEKNKRKVIDYHDFCLLAIHILKSNNANPWDFIFVDEAQDLYPSMHRVIQLLTQHTIVYCLDPKQSIMGFTGTSLEDIEKIHEWYPHIRSHTLSQNFRSSIRVIEIANQVGPKIHKLSVPMVPMTENLGDVQYLGHFNSPQEESRAIVHHIQTRNLSDVLILYRTHWYSIAMQMELMNQDIPYTVSGLSPFLQIPEIQHLLAYIRLSQDMNDKEALFAILNIPTRYFDKQWFNTFYQVQFGRKTEEILSQSIAGPIYLLENQKKLLADLKVMSILKTPHDVIYYIREEMKYDKWLSKDKIDLDDSDMDPLDTISYFHDFTQGKSFDEIINLKPNVGGKIKLSSIHKAKGTESQSVYVIGCTEGILPHHKANREEELRLFYVAITRAKENLYLSSCKYLQFIDPSQFLQI